ncbi:cache domain-containing protein [Leucobacter sp.]
MSAPESVRETLDRLSSWFTQHFERLQSLADELISTLRFSEDGLIEISDSTRRRLKSAAVRFLAEDETIDGCGLIFAHSALGTENGHLEWWVREDESRFARYSFGVVPGADRYYDYEHHEWFIRSFHEGTPALVGPYIDYLGVEAYVLTLTVPAEIRGTRVGAVGNDIQVADLEAALLPVLLDHPSAMALIGRHGNVIFSNSSRFLPGDYVPESLPGFRRARIDPAQAGVQLLYADS